VACFDCTRHFPFPDGVAALMLSYLPAHLRMKTLPCRSLPPGKEGDPLEAPAGGESRPELKQTEISLFSPSPIHPSIAFGLLAKYITTGFMLISARIQVVLQPWPGTPVVDGTAHELRSSIHPTVLCRSTARSLYVTLHKTTPSFHASMYFMDAVRYFL
jgi:hypothetical protein